MRELASAGQTCREMRQAFLTRLTEERARLVSVGEEFLGKEMFSSFVKAFQACMKSPLRPDWKSLVVDKAGKQHVPAAQFFDTEWCRIDVIGSPTEALDATIRCKPPGSTVCAYIYMRVNRVDRKREGPLEVFMEKGTAAATVALLLAIFSPESGEAPETTPTFWGLPLNTLLLDFRRPWYVREKADAEDLVGPLRSLAQSFAFDDPAPCSLRPGRRTGPARPFACLAVFWDPRH